MAIIPNPSTLIRTSVVLTGLLGLRFDGIPTGNGKTTTLAGMIPIQVACLNQTTPLQVIDSFSKVSKQLLPKSFKQSGLFGMANPSITGYPKSKPEFINDLPTVITATIPKKASTYPGIKPSSISTPSPIQSKITGQALAKQKQKYLTGRTVSSCEDSTCLGNETCVTWIKDTGMDSPSNENQSTPSGTHECILQDLTSPIAFSPVNPTSNQLCPDEQTHSVTSGSFRKQCPTGIPCPIIWKFNCVDKQNSPHDCSLKNCPLNACVEEMNCKLGEDSRPCIPQATCLPPYFFPSMAGTS